MPISTNAPFNEFGQSQILRDIEQLYLALNGAGNGAPGDGQTQDQTAATSQDSGGLPDLSGLATISYVDESIAAIPGITYPISIANGGTGATTSITALRSLGSFAYSSSIYSSSGAQTVPAGVSRMRFVIIGGGGGGVDGDDTRLFTNIGDYTDVPTVGGAGGGGEIGIFDVGVVPGESYTITCGPGGARSATTASDGGFTSIVFASDSLTLKVFGGSGATHERGGAGGYGATGYVTNPRANTTYYTISGQNGSTGGLGGGSFSASIGGRGITSGGPEFGKGGNGAYPYGTGSAGEPGCAIIFY
jgi:hypothetical protein